MTAVADPVTRSSPLVDRTGVAGLGAAAVIGVLVLVVRPALPLALLAGAVVLLAVVELTRRLHRQQTTARALEAQRSDLFSQRQSTNSGLCSPPPGVRTSISLSSPVKRSTNHFCF